MTFKDIPQFTSDGNYAVDTTMEYLVKTLDEFEKEDGLQMEPDFQRGHVWTEDQQVKYLEYFLRGGKTGRDLYFNKPDWNYPVPKGAYNDFVCVDGLQRITAVRRFINNEIKVFGQTYSEFGGTTSMTRHTFRLHINDLKTKREVLVWYIEMNTGGTPHTDEEIEKVRELLQKA